MKVIIVLLFFIVPFSARSQKIALLNTAFQSPIIYTDSVTVQQVTNGLFPVNVNDFDTLYANLDFINQMLEKRQRSKMKSFELHSGATIITISRVPFSNGDRYIIKAKTEVGEVTSSLNLTDVTKSNKKNSERIEKIMEYLKTNKELFKIPYPVHPKIYNVVVVTE
ncbi:MAG: hypothetical protein ACTHOB_08220 [Ginsengibacter sp.]